MLISAEYDAFLVKTARTVGPYLNQLVFVGGCAGALYTRTSAASSGLMPMVTKDIDIAGSIGLETPVDTLPLAKLMTEAGFVEEFLASAASSPVVKYVPQDGEKTFDVEFLCPRPFMKGYPMARAIYLFCFCFFYPFSSLSRRLGGS